MGAEDYVATSFRTANSGPGGFGWRQGNFYHCLAEHGVEVSYCPAEGRWQIGGIERCNAVLRTITEHLVDQFAVVNAEELDDALLVPRLTGLFNRASPEAIRHIHDVADEEGHPEKTRWLWRHNHLRFGYQKHLKLYQQVQINVDRPTYQHTVVNPSRMPVLMFYHQYLKETRKNMSDFERFKVMCAKQKRSKEVKKAGANFTNEHASAHA
ncbi:unnamed protein product [Effrenium voratum]|uniref:Uncharacterized protein n=1 Tax=Effrenium voratum TaxID=2562239 RepID=A0AA36ILC8_9DINO|nr:unnamed protein product [Effrenium voratum]